MNRNNESIFSFLTEEGFRPKRDEDEDIVFKYQGDVHIVIFHEDDPDFASLTKYISLEFDSGQSPAIYELLNKVNTMFIVGKATIRGEDDKALVLKVDSLGTVIEFQENLERYLTIIQQMEKSFMEEYFKIVS